MESGLLPTLRSKYPLILFTDWASSILRSPLDPYMSTNAQRKLPRYFFTLSSLLTRAITPMSSKFSISLSMTLMRLLLMQRLLLTQSFHLALTPSLKEAISLLQLSSLELLHKMKEFSEVNPFFEASMPYRTSGSPGFSPQNEAPFEDQSTYNLSFTLTQSLVHMKFPDPTFEAALSLIGDLDDHGFFPSQRFDALPLAVQRDIDQWLSTVEPIGVGARSTLQSFIWQLNYRSDFKDRSEVKELVSLLEALSSSTDLLTHSCQWTHSLKAKRFEKVIKSLHWSPRDAYRGPQEQNHEAYAVDLIMYQENGDYKVRLNPENMPHIEVQCWPKEVSKKHECRKYYQQALLFQKMIHTRWDTLQKAASYLVFYQKDFFKFGKRSLRPLILAEIAQQIGLHESTISRIIHNKNILTPFGVIELKKLLSRPIKKTYGEQSSHCAVLEVLANCIAHEDPQTPYSDQELTNILAKQGFCIARRTVAKYREQMQIASSHQRRIIKGDSSYES